MLQQSQKLDNEFWEVFEGAGHYPVPTKMMTVLWNFVLHLIEVEQLKSLLLASAKGHSRYEAQHAIDWI